MSAFLVGDNSESMKSELRTCMEKESSCINDAERFPERRLFKFIKPERFLKELDKRLPYSYIKYFAVIRLETILAQQLRMIYTIKKCDCDEPQSELSRNLFSWEMKHYMDRRNLTDPTYITELEKLSNKSLKNFKFTIDLIQLFNYITLIYDGIYADMGHFNLNISEHIEKPLNEARTLILLNILKEEEYKENVSRYELSFNNRRLRTLSNDGGEEKLLKRNLQSKLSQRHIWDPIELRYIMNWHKSQLDGKKKKMDIIEKRVLRNIEKYTLNTEHELIATDNCMEFLFGFIDQLKSDITKIQVKYDTDNENIDSELLSKRLQIDKIRERHRFLKDEIIRFHIEIEQSRNANPRKSASIHKRRRSNSRRSFNNKQK